jgi:hypothetical protein
VKVFLYDVTVASKEKERKAAGYRYTPTFRELRPSRKLAKAIGNDKAPGLFIPRASTDIRFCLAHSTYLTTTLTSSSLYGSSFALEIAWSLYAFSLYEHCPMIF